VFTYLAPSLAVPERVRYKYKLEGLDESWSNPVSAREVTYNNLNSGKYRFRLIASNGDGMWESAESDVTFSITPPYWQTIWFRLGIALVTALGILLIYRLRMRQLAEQLNMRFEERLAERTRIAQELHDTLLQGFLSASMQLHVVADKLPDDSAAKPALDRVLLLMGRVTEEGRNAVGGLRSTEGSSGDLALAFSQIQQEFPGQEQVSFHVIVEGSPRTLRPVARDEIYRIGRESLTNAFRHSKAASVEVELEYAAKQLRVLVRDSGAGFDPQILQFGRQGHWGLSGMRERAKGIGASLRVWSRPGAGTEVELTVPGNIAYVPEPPGRVAKWISRWLPRGKGRFDQKSTREPER